MYTMKVEHYSNYSQWKILIYLKFIEKVLPNIINQNITGKMFLIKLKNFYIDSIILILYSLTMTLNPSGII